MHAIDFVTPERDVVIGPSSRMRAVFEFLRVVSSSESTVVITGESGTGKEVIATLIHQQSRRKHRPFVAVSCALFSETLIESELFGHERGAFTGAIKDRPGRFEQANGGTMLLDDIDDVPLAMQVKLLRVLQNPGVHALLWPGNVRELENMCERMAQTNTCGTLRTGCIAASIMFRATDSVSPPVVEARQIEPVPVSLEARLREVETELLDRMTRYQLRGVRVPASDLAVSA